MRTKKKAGELQEGLNTTLTNLKKLCKSSNDSSEILLEIKRAKKLLSEKDNYYSIKNTKKESRVIQEIGALLKILEMRLSTLQANLSSAVQKNTSRLLRVLKIPIDDVSKSDLTLFKNLKVEFEELNRIITKLDENMGKQILGSLSPEAQNLEKKISLFEKQILAHQSIITEPEPASKTIIAEEESFSDNTDTIPIIIDSLPNIDPWVYRFVSMIAFVISAYSALDNAIRIVKNIIPQSQDQLSEDFDYMLMPSDPDSLDEEHEEEFFETLLEPDLKTLQEKINWIVQSPNTAEKLKQFDELMRECEHYLVDSSELLDLKILILAEKLAWVKINEIGDELISEMDKQLQDILGIDVENLPERQAYIAAIKNSNFRVDVITTDEANVKEEFLKTLKLDSAYINAQSSLLEKIKNSVTTKLTSIQKISAVYSIVLLLQNASSPPTTFKNNLKKNIESYLKSHHQNCDIQLLINNSNDTSSLTLETLKKINSEIVKLKNPQNIPKIKIDSEDIRKIITAMEAAIMANASDSNHDNLSKKEILTLIKHEFNNTESSQKLVYLELFLKVAATHRRGSFGFFHVPGLKTKTIREFEKSIENIQSIHLINLINKQIHQAQNIDIESNRMFGKNK